MRRLEPSVIPTLAGVLAESEGSPAGNAAGRHVESKADRRCVDNPNQWGLAADEASAMCMNVRILAILL